MTARRITDCRLHSLHVPLLAPFTTATAAPKTVQNLAISIRLADGTVGWGETPILPPITAETQSLARDLLESELPHLIGRDVTGWRRLGHELREKLPDYASVRAGIEMATIDAFARSYNVPLRALFGGFAADIVTDMTIPICASQHASALALEYRNAGFTTLKVKIGHDLDEDNARLHAIHSVFPAARLVLDANAGYGEADMLKLLHDLLQRGIRPDLLEQPVPRDDWEGLARVARETGLTVAADESCRDPEDILRLHRLQAAQVVNLKLAKSGVITSLQMAETACACGLDLMIGGMVETRMAMSFSAHFASGLGGFTWIDLDTPLLMSNDPVQGGCRIVGSRYHFDDRVAGHGASLYNVTDCGT